MLTTTVGSLSLQSPLMTGSGTFGHDPSGLAFLGPGDLGALVLKTVTPKPRAGNPMPRMVETPAGVLNSIGLENRGLEAFLTDTVPALASLEVPVVANVGGHSVAEYAQMVAALQGTDVFVALEINLSCPNVDGGRLPFATDADKLSAAMRACREETDLPLWAKLSPNVADMVPFAQAAETAGAAAVTVANTLLGLVVDWQTRRPVLGTGQGGLAGPAVRPIILRWVHLVSKAISIPVLASGGASSAKDVLDYLVAGAAAVQIGAASFSDPGLIGRIAADLRGLLNVEDIGIAELVGSLQEGEPSA